MTTAEILQRFRSLRALVLGDICLDRWCTYDPAAAEPSRETGIPRIAVTSTHVTAGAGGTVASNLAALGCGSVSVLGAIGEDGFAYELKQALRHAGVESSLLVEVPGSLTFTYTKLLNARTGEEDLPRVDFINSRPMPPRADQAVLTHLTDAIGNADVILVSDQAETEQGGVITAAVRDRLASLAQSFPAKVFWVDSRLRAEKFRHVIVKPNEREAAEASQRLLGRIDFAALRSAIGPHPLVVTHGSSGAEVWDCSGSRFIPTTPVANPVDICGAGDSFSAGAALALAATGSIDDAVRMGNHVASITIMKKGTGTASQEEVLGAAI